HHLALRLPHDRGQANADATNSLALRAGSSNQPANQADQLLEIALAVIVGNLMHFCLHDAFKIGHGAIKLALAGLDADYGMRRTVELDARQGSAPRRLVEAIMGDQIL